MSSSLVSKIRQNMDPFENIVILPFKLNQPPNSLTALHNETKSDVCKSNIIIRIKTKSNQQIMKSTRPQSD